METSDQKSFWKEIGKFGIGRERKKEIPCEVKLSNGEVISLKMFGKHVSKIYLIVIVIFLTFPTNHKNVENVIVNLMLIFSRTESKSNKAVGPDDFPAEVLKRSKQYRE